MTAWTDAGGCLTEQGLRAVAAAAPGQAPADLAAHLAGCVRCQRRLLASDGGVGVRAPARARTSPQRVALIGLTMLLALLGLLWSARLLLG